MNPPDNVSPWKLTSRPGPTFPNTIMYDLPHGKGEYRCYLYGLDIYSHIEEYWVYKDTGGDALQILENRTLTPIKDIPRLLKKVYDELLILEL